MKKQSFIKAALAGIFMIAAGATNAAETEVSCTAAQDHPYLQGYTIPFSADEVVPGRTYFTIHKGDFDDLFGRAGRSTVEFLGEMDEAGQRDATIDGYEATITEAYDDNNESVIIDMDTDAFKELFGAAPDSSMTKNKWACTMQTPAP